MSRTEHDAISIEALKRRAWVGDRELIDKLSRVASGMPSALTAIPVEPDDLGEACDQPVASIADLDLDTGSVWPAELFDIGTEPDESIPMMTSGGWPAHARPSGNSSSPSAWCRCRSQRSIGHRPAHRDGIVIGDGQAHRAARSCSNK